MTPYLPCLKALERVRKRVEAELYEKHRLRCAVGEWIDSAGIKLQKDSWTDEGFGDGIFFSVWVGEKDVEKNRFNYNIHALKLRSLTGYTIKSREFADSFRRKFRGSAEGWPNVSTDYGPQTLMQGWMELNDQTFEGDVLALLDRFVAIHEIIDEMLKERKAA